MLHEISYYYKKVGEEHRDKVDRCYYIARGVPVEAFKRQFYEARWNQNQDALRKLHGRVQKELFKLESSKEKCLNCPVSHMIGQLEQLRHMIEEVLENFSLSSHLQIG